MKVTDNDIKDIEKRIEDAEQSIFDMLGVIPFNEKNKKAYIYISDFEGLIKNSDFIKLLNHLHSLLSERLKLINDLECCNSNDPDSMCRSCNCWKATRANCS
jgi:hypothetical protein